MRVLWSSTPKKVKIYRPTLISITDFWWNSEVHRYLTASVADLPLRLAGGNSPRVGRLEVQYMGDWGIVCNNAWNQRGADVVCRQLGYLYVLCLLQNLITE